MAAPRATACLSLLPLLFVAASAAGTFEEIQPTTYKQLEAVKGQWSLSVAANGVARNCSKEAVAAPCNQPPLNADAGDKLTVTAALKGDALRTAGDLDPKRVLLKACYAKPSTADRPWRKPNDVIDKDRSCPFIIKATNFSGGSVTADWPIPKNMTKAAWYAQVMVQCQNGTQLSFCQYDNTKNASYWSTSIINSTPTPMIIATAVCSAIAPIFLAVFFARDVWARKQQ